MGFDSWFWSRREGGIRVDLRIVWLQRQPMLLKYTVRIVCKRNTLGHTNRLTRLQGALREYLQAVIRRCLKHNNTKVSMLALGGDSVD